MDEPAGGQHDCPSRIEEADELATPLPPHLLLELGRKALDPAVQQDVVELDAAIRQHQLEVAIADRELQVSAHRPEDDLGREAEAAEGPGLGHERCSRVGYRLERRS